MRSNIISSYESKLSLHTARNHISALHQIIMSIGWWIFWRRDIIFLLAMQGQTLCPMGYVIVSCCTTRISWMRNWTIRYSYFEIQWLHDNAWQLWWIWVNYRYTRARNHIRAALNYHVHIWWIFCWCDVTFLLALKRQTLVQWDVWSSHVASGGFHEWEIKQFHTPSLIYYDLMIMHDD